MIGKNIAAALVKAQKSFAPALKTSTNQHFRSKYADLSACVEAVIDSLNANGVCLIQRTHDDESGVKVETVFIHESGEMLECGALRVPANKQDAHGYGAALTYARRYSLMAACCIAPEDDDGNAACKKPVLSESAKSVAQATFDSMGEEQQAFLKELAVNVIASLPDEVGAYNTYVNVSTNLDADEKTALWSLFDSKLRSTIKRIGQTTKGE